MKRIELSAVQQRFINIMRDQQVSDLLIGGAAGGPQPLSAKIQTPNGAIKMRDIKVGDTICSGSRDGIQTVIDIPYEGKRMVYKLVFEDEATTRAADSHLWKAKVALGNANPDNIEYALYTTKDLYAKKNAGYRIYMPLAPEANGGKIINNSKDFFLRCLEWSKIENFDKIPKDILNYSADLRLQLLKAFCDKYATSANGELYLNIPSIKTSKRIVQIIRSLGANARLFSRSLLTPDGKYEEHPYIFVQGNNVKDFIGGNVTVYCGLYLEGKQHQYKELISVKRQKEEQVRCITVSDEEGLYLTDDYIVTHNSKTYSMCLAMAIFAHEYPGIHFALGRKTLKELRQSTVVTLISKVHEKLGLHQSDYRYSQLDNEIIYKNGSRITMIEMDYLPSDPDFTRFGSLEFDWGFVDEAGEITQQAKDVLRSRLGRGIATGKFHLTPKLVLSCNPAVNFLRSEYYNPYKKLGGGQYQQWQIGTLLINGVEKPAYRGFLRFTVNDNPFIDKNYINTLKQMPARQRKRLLEGNWDFADNERMLFPGELLDEVIIGEMPDLSLEEKADIRLGVDVADVGGDSNVISVMRGGVLVEQERFNLHYLRSNQEIAIGEEVAKRVVRKAKRLGLTEKDAKRICIEINGVGASARDFLRKMGWRTVEYSAKQQTRSNMYYALNQLMVEGKVKILKCDGLDVQSLREQLAPHEYEMVGEKPRVVAKKEIKRILGCSPDLADSFAICTYPMGMALELPDVKTISRVYTGSSLRTPRMRVASRPHFGFGSLQIRG